jgi:formylglycine-generating enzyme required for sulfatase activity
VTNLSWDEANDYASWVGGRLPSEAEWEKACRGMDARTYPWGNQAPKERLLNYASTGLGTWTAVGGVQLGASPYGVLDMAGNVWEWTSSPNRPYPYTTGNGGEDPGNREERVLRGGGFKADAGLVRCGVRFADPPDFRSEDLGFRVVVPSHYP